MATRKQRASLFTQPELKENSKLALIPKLQTKHSKLRPEHLVQIEALTDNQQKIFELFNKTDQHLFLYGYAGTGKSFCALYLALRAIVVEKRYKKIILVRSTVSTRDVGFLPGTLEEKEAVYKMPFADIFKDLVVHEIPNPIEKLEEQKIFEFRSSSFVRGSTFKDAVIIVEEFQNMHFTEIFSILSRAGTNSRVVMCGDAGQNDLLVNGTNKMDKTCFADIKTVTERMGCFSPVKLGKDDIVRSAFVKELIITCSDLGLI